MINCFMSVSLLARLKLHEAGTNVPPLQVPNCASQKVGTRELCAGLLDKQMNEYKKEQMSESWKNGRCS